jgi:hypothetical protein
MLPRRKKRAIDLIAVSIDQFLAIGDWQTIPQGFQHRPASIAHPRGNNLSGLAGTRHPEPKTALLTNAEFVYLDGIARGGVQHGRFPLLGYLDCPFFRTALTVVRLTLSKRAMPRCEIRSANAR